MACIKLKNDSKSVFIRPEGGRHPIVLRRQNAAVGHMDGRGYQQPLDGAELFAEQLKITAAGLSSNFSLDGDTVRGDDAAATEAC